jgi:hypothetical protein
MELQAPIYTNIYLNSPHSGSKVHRSLWLRWSIISTTRRSLVWWRHHRTLPRTPRHLWRLRVWYATHTTLPTPDLWWLRNRLMLE